MDNLEYLNKVKDNQIDFDHIQEYDLKYRNVRALEIIAEEQINNNSTLRTLVTTLENIETAIRQGGL